jgi:cytochrome P450
MSYTEPTTAPEPAFSAEPAGVDVFSLDPETNRHPQEMYRDLRAAAPVLPLGDMGVVLTTKEAAMEAFRRPEVFSSAATADTLAMGSVRPLIPLQIDPPDHVKYRKILDPLFAPRHMAELEEPVAALVNDLIDGFVDRGECDFSAEFSVPLPSQVFLTLLGLPLSDLDLFLKMKDGIIRPDHVVGKPRDHADTLAYQNGIGQSVYDYFNDVLDEREVERRDDLLSRFLDAEVDGHRLTREDILDICFLFFIAGLDTVSASLDCFFGYLCEHPDQRAQLVADPALVPSAVEELLRWESPVGGIMRVAAADTELFGCPIKQGEMVSISLGSVDTDEAALPDAYDVRFDRDVNPHNAFGGGVHRCLGSHLARLELRVALREWHARIPEYAVKEGHELVYTPAIRSLDTFPMVFGPMVFNGR